MSRVSYFFDLRVYLFFPANFHLATHLHSRLRVRYRRTDGQTAASNALCCYTVGAGHNKIRIRLHTKMGNSKELMINFIRTG